MSSSASKLNSTNEEKCADGSDTLAGSKATPPRGSDINDDLKSDTVQDCYRKHPCILDPMDAMMSIADYAGGKFNSRN